jgi:hypothetical protein
MIDSQDHIFHEPNRSTGSKLLAVLTALLLTALVFGGYTLLRRRHAQDAALSTANSAPATPARRSPKALVVVDEALLQGGKTIISGTVRNTSSEQLGELAVELELKRRNDGTTETQFVGLQPAQLEPQQEGRYSLQLRAQEYGSARLVALKSGSNQLPIPYVTAQGQKRPAERLESKTVIIGKPSSSKAGEFLNSPDNPARVP